MISPGRVRLAAIAQLRSTIFQTAYNPSSVRSGAKYLRARLRGPSMVQYYPEVLNLSRLAARFPESGMKNWVEEQRLEDVRERKERGKGTPTKAKSKDESRRATRKR